MDPSVYIFAQMDVKDYKSYLTEYGKPFMSVLEKFEGELLSGTAKSETLEGQSFGNWTILLRFPSEALAQKFIHSKEYAPLKKMRIDSLINEGRAYLFPETVSA